MDIVKQNPYRVLGLLANSSERELQKQIAIIKRFSEVGKSKTFDCDFEFIGELSRNSEDVQNAASKIEQAHKKVHYSIFWFINTCAVDDVAFNSLKEGNKEKADYVWNKTLKSEISAKNYSSYHNLSTLYILSALEGGKINIQMMKKGVELKGELLKSPYLSTLVELVGGGVVVDQEHIVKMFADDVIEIIDSVLDSNFQDNNKTIIKLFDGYPDYLKKYVLEKYTSDPFRKIEAEIEKIQKKRNEQPKNANVFWKPFFISTKNNVGFLKDLLGDSDIQLQMAVDEISSELMQCSIDYFNEWRESGDIDPGEEALMIAKKASSFRPKGRARDRIEENMHVIQEWVDEAPQRNLIDKVSVEVDTVTSCIEEFDEVVISKMSINRLVSQSEPELRKIKNLLGKDDEFYLDISSAVVVRVLGGLIDLHNNGQNSVINNGSSLDEFASTLEWIIAVISKIQNYFGMTSEIRRRVNLNAQTMNGTKSQVESAIKESSDGCYIATMAYGDYDHPRVLILREYRDEVLSSNMFGRLFIKFYYSTSPYLVMLLKNQKVINSVIRKLLDKWTEVIKK